MRAPELNSPCWMVKNERKGEEDSCPFGESEIDSEIIRIPPLYILEISIA
jgi:hypothetical protein